MKALLCSLKSLQKNITIITKRPWRWNNDICLIKSKELFWFEPISQQQAVVITNHPAFRDQMNPCSEVLSVQLENGAFKSASSLNTSIPKSQDIRLGLAESCTVVYWSIQTGNRCESQSTTVVNGSSWLNPHKCCLDPCSTPNLAMKSLGCSRVANYGKLLLSTVTHQHWGFRSPKQGNAQLKPGWL